MHGTCMYVSSIINVYGAMIGKCVHFIHSLKYILSDVRMYICRYSLNLYTLLNGQNPYVTRQQSWMIGVLEQAERDGEQVSVGNLLCLLIETLYLLLYPYGPLFHTQALYLHPVHTQVHIMIVITQRFGTKYIRNAYTHLAVTLPY